MSSSSKLEKRRWIGILLFGFSVCLLSAGVLYVNREALHVRQLFGDFYLVPWDGFVRITGLEPPAHAKVIAYAYDDWIMDWEYYLAFETDHETIDRWLSVAPPLEVETWTRGPVPFEALKPSFGMESVMQWHDGNNLMRYDGDDRLVRLLTSDQVWYAAVDRCCDGMRFHDGSLVVLDPELDRVWVASWGYYSIQTIEHELFHFRQCSCFATMLFREV